MHLNYILLAHKNPFQLQRLVERLQNEQSSFYIHIDENIDISPFIEALQDFRNISFLQKDFREKGTWGDIGIVKATINAMRHIIEDQRTGYCILLSGLDYPLRSSTEIQDFFKINKGKHFIDLFSIPTNLWGGDQGLERINKYKINFSQKRYHFFLLPSIFEREFYSRKTIGKLFFLLKKGKGPDFFKLLQRRRHPSQIKPYGGTQWWAFPNETTKEILEFIDQYPDFLKFHNFTLLPDEIFFHSILIHLRNNKAIEKSLTYTNWDPARAPLPVTFAEKDFEELKKASENYLFARKFDLNSDYKILNRIDAELLK